MNILCLYKYVGSNRYLVRIEWKQRNESIPNKLCGDYTYYTRYSKSFASPSYHWSILKFRHSSFMGILSCKGCEFWEKDNFCKRNFPYGILMIETL